MGHCVAPPFWPRIRTCPKRRHELYRIAQATARAHAKAGHEEDSLTPTELRNAIDVWARANPGVFDVRNERDGSRLTEVASAKQLKLTADEITTIETRQNRNTGAEYLALQFAERPPLALANQGFVFALDTRNTGPLPGAPPSMSFGDYRKLRRHLHHLTRGRDDPERRREALDLSLILIASLDGARAVGLPTQVEEVDLEKAIRQLESGA